MSRIGATFTIRPNMTTFMYPSDRMARTDKEIEEILSMGAYRKHARMVVLRRLLGIVL